MTDSPLPLGEVVTPTLDEWDHRAGGWDTWVGAGEDFRVHVEMVDLEVPPSDALTGFEIRLEDLRAGRPYPMAARETVRNSRVALLVAEDLAAHALKFGEEWNEGVAPRPEEVVHRGE